MRQHGSIKCPSTRKSIVILDSRDFAQIKKIYFRKKKFLMVLMTLSINRLLRFLSESQTFGKEDR
jgi:hypothetical protein